MRDDRARLLADVVLGAAAIGLAYYVVKTPPLRRAAWQFARAALTTTIPVWLATELRQAWAESGRRTI